MLELPLPPWYPRLGALTPAMHYTHILTQGKLPADLVGTYFRNGPGRIRVGARRYGHWFDGEEGVGLGSGSACVYACMHACIYVCIYDKSCGGSLTGW
jgi:hypothetical protein